MESMAKTLGVDIYRAPRATNPLDYDHRVISEELLVLLDNIIAEDVSKLWRMEHPHLYKHAAATVRKHKPREKQRARRLTHGTF
jgi:hypothetical protein